MAAWLRPEERRRSFQPLVGPPQLSDLLLKFPHTLRLRRPHTHSDTIVDVGLLHPRPHGLNPITQLRRNALHRPLCDTELRSQCPDHPHRGGLLLLTVATRHQLPIRHFLRHNSILVPKTRSLQETQDGSLHTVIRLEVRALKCMTYLERLQNLE